MQLAIIAALAAAIVGVVFAMQNNVPVTLNFLLWRFDSSLALVILLALALGAIVTALVTTPATLRSQWRQSRQKRQIAQLEKTAGEQRQQIADLEKRMPVEPEPAVPEKNYVGLRSLIAGKGDDSPDKPDNQ